MIPQIPIMTHRPLEIVVQLEEERIKELKTMEIKKFKVPSKSQPGTFRIVEVLPNGKAICDCPASFGRGKKPCRHKRIIIKHLIKQGVARIYGK